MANLTLELNINSARLFKNVNLMTKMDVYAVTTIHGDDTQKKQKVKTAVDRSGGSKPIWNHAVKFPVNERLARDGRLALDVRLVCRRVLGNKDIGGVNVTLLELLKSCTPSSNDHDGNGQEMASVTYQVKSSSGKRKGYLNFEYRFVTPPVKPDLLLNRISVGTVGFSPTSYPIEHLPSSSTLSGRFTCLYSRPALLSASSKSSNACSQLSLPPFLIGSDHKNHPVAAGSSFDPLPISNGPVAPQASSQQGYATPSQGRYGYGCLSTRRPKGMELGLGLGAGILGGLIIGDFVSDVANYFDL